MGGEEVLTEDWESSVVGMNVFVVVVSDLRYGCGSVVACCRYIVE